MELYQNDDMFAELCSKMYEYYRQRSSKLKERDAKREQEAGWYHRKDMLGMMLYIDNFAGNMQGVKEKIPYLKECNINCLHLMPFLDTPEGRSDGGYAVADFRKVRPNLGTMKDLAELTEKCHEEDINGNWEKIERRSYEIWIYPGSSCRKDQCVQTDHFKLGK